MPSSSFPRKPPQKKLHLHHREWGVIALILGFFGAINVIAHFSQIRRDQLLESYIPLEERKIEIHIEGAVTKPGTYHCRPGAQLKEVVEEAGILETANRRRVPFKKVLYSSQTIEIPAKKTASHERKKISLEEN